MNTKPWATGAFLGLQNLFFKATNNGIITNTATDRNLPLTTETIKQNKTFEFTEEANNMHCDTQNLQLLQFLRLG